MKRLPWILFLCPCLAAAASFRFEAETDFSHGVGRQVAGGWSADPAQDGAGYLMTGPATTLVHRGFAEARVRLKTSAAAGANDKVVRVDVVDLATGSTLASRTIRRQQFPGQDVYRTFLLDFPASQGNALDFRVYFYDIIPVTADYVDAVTDERPLSRFGVNAHVPDGPRLDLAAAAHLRMLRMDFNWPVIEPSRGALDYSSFDNAVDLALGHGQATLATLAFTPAWATSGAPQTSPPDQMGDWFNFVYATVTHFKGRVRYWSIWNEPNLSKFFTGTMGDYINLVKVAASAIRQADPDSFIVGPEISTLGSSNWDGWLDSVLSFNRAEIDIVAVHIYQDIVSEITRKLDGPSYPWEPPDVRQIMANNGMGDTPIWLTETGWTSASHGETGQASLVRQVYQEMLPRSWWAKTFIYELADPPGSGLTWGLLREDLSKKQAYDAAWETALDGANEAWILAAPGAGPHNPPYVIAYTWDGLPAMWLAAYGSTGYGARVSGAWLDATKREMLLTGPGPGAVYGPQVRAFLDTAVPVAPVNFYAYGTLRYGVNVAAGDIDGDALHEIVTGGGPGQVFGPHVRAFNYDGNKITGVSGISFFAYGTLRYGVNVAVGSPDADFYDEILTGPGPSQAFGGQLRGWNFDGVRLAPLANLNVFAFGSGSYGCEVALADLDGSAPDELVTAPGPAPALGPTVRSFTYDGTLPKSYFDVVAFPGTLYGGRIAPIEVDGGGASGLLVSAGPDPNVTAPVQLLSIPASGPIAVPGFQSFSPYPAYRYGVNVGSIRFN